MPLINPRPALILGASAAPLDVPSDTTEDILATINIAAGQMGLNGILDVTLQWNMTSSANNKTLRTRFSGIGGTVYGTVVLTTTTNYRQNFQIANRGAANSQIGLDGTNGGWNVNIGPTTSSVDTSAATTLVITGQKQSAGETLTLASYRVNLLLPGLN